VSSNGASAEHSTGGAKRSADDSQSASESAGDVIAAGGHKVPGLGEWLAGYIIMSVTVSNSVCYHTKQFCITSLSLG